MTARPKLRREEAVSTMRSDLDRAGLSSRGNFCIVAPSSDPPNLGIEWDAENRLIRVCSGDCFPSPESSSEFSYDGRQRRVRIVEKLGTVTRMTGTPMVQPFYVRRTGFLGSSPLVHSRRNTGVLKNVVLTLLLICVLPFVACDRRFLECVEVAPLQPHEMELARRILDDLKEEKSLNCKSVEGPQIRGSYEPGDYDLEWCVEPDEYTSVQIAIGSDRVAVEFHELGWIFESDFLVRARDSLSALFTEQFGASRVTVHQECHAQR